jgi:hypothetical protein
MQRTCFFFGNGLGMAVEPDYFKLSTGMTNIWNLATTEGGLSSEEKIRISQLTCADAKTPPKSEEQLELLHQVNTACKTINAIDCQSIPWTSKPITEFPNSVNKFIGLVAKHFTTRAYSLPADFVASLTEIIKKSSGHIITINYDILLYQPLIVNESLCGYNGLLVDGFHKGGFKDENLERKYGKSFGWYLHLHGSPLYLSYPSEIHKINIPDLDHSYEDPSQHRHIVLAHTKFKPDIIINSEVLSTYWVYFSRALIESNLLYIFGYSGNDYHINDTIRAWYDEDTDHKIHIIEWENPSEDDIARKEYWKTKLSNTGKSNFQLHRLPNILDYRW